MSDFSTSGLEQLNGLRATAGQSEGYMLPHGRPAMSESSNEMPSSDTRLANGRLARIEALPPELLFYLSRFLDLTALILVSTATSHTLRRIFAQFDRELLFLEPAHRLNLAEWREAAQQIDRMGLTRSSSNVRPPLSQESDTCCGNKVDIDLNQTMRQLTRDESLIDLHLLQSVLVFLSNRMPNTESDGSATSAMLPSRSQSQSTSVNQIRCLHLTGWHGIAGAFLIQQLRSQPSLKDVRTVVKTDRADSRIWEQAASDDRHDQMPVSQRSDSAQERIRGASWPHRFDPPERSRGVESTIMFNECVATQIIVQVGKRRPRRPDQPFLRGEGLQMGFQGYCIDVRTCSDGDLLTESRLSAEGSATNAETKVDSNESIVSSEGQAASRKRLHVILQGREVEDGKQNEEMFERSIVSCNHCKQRIVF